MLAPLSLPLTATPYIPQRTQRRVSQQNDTATITTIATIWATTRHELLTAKAHGSSATITSNNPDLNLIDHSSPPVLIILCGNNMDEIR